MLSLFSSLTEQLLCWVVSRWLTVSFGSLSSALCDHFCSISLNDAGSMAQFIVLFLLALTGSMVQPCMSMPKCGLRHVTQRMCYAYRLFSQVRISSQLLNLVWPVRSEFSLIGNKKTEKKKNTGEEQSLLPSRLLNIHSSASSTKESWSSTAVFA